MVCCGPGRAWADGTPLDGELTAVSVGNAQVLPTNASVYVGVRGGGQAVLGHVTQGMALPDVAATQVGSDSWGAVYVYRVALPTLQPGAASVNVQAPQGARLINVVMGDGPDLGPPVMHGTPSISATYVDATHYNVVMEVDRPDDDGGMGYYVVNLVDGGTVGYQVHDSDAITARTQVFFHASGAVKQPCYVVVATDLAGNVSGPSEPACVDLAAAQHATCACQGAAADGSMAWGLAMLAWGAVLFKRGRAF
jgi:hypothetical protein